MNLVACAPWGGWSTGRYESTDKEAKESGTEDDCEEIDSSGDDKSEEDIVLPELSSGPNSEHDVTSGKQEYCSIDESDKIGFAFPSDSDEGEFYGFD